MVGMRGYTVDKNENIINEIKRANFMAKLPTIPVNPDIGNQAQAACNDMGLDVVTEFSRLWYNKPNEADNSEVTT